MNSNLKNWIKIIFLLVFGVGGFVFLFILGKKQSETKQEMISKNLGEAQATVIRTGYSKGSYVLAEFYFKNERIEFKDYPPSDKSITGLSFPVTFDSLDPSIAKLDFEKPYFSDNIEVGKTKGNIIASDDNSFEFEYNVNDKKYSQFIKFSHPSEINKTGSYEVFFLKNNPQVSFMKIQ